MDKTKISQENDQFRTTLVKNFAAMRMGFVTTPESFGDLKLRGRLVFTQGVVALPHHEEAELLAKIQEFNEFNDPYGEHDFGKVTVEGTDYFWKIDYYDESYRTGAAPESDQVHRVLTIMEASEY